MLTGKGQAQICGNQDAPRWRAQQRTGWKAGHWEPFIPSDGLVCFVHQLDQAARAAHPQIAFAVGDDAVPAFGRKLVAGVEINNLTGINAAQAGFAPKPDSSTAIQPHAVGWLSREPSNSVRTIFQCLYHCQTLRGGYIQTVVLVGSKTSGAEDFDCFP